MVKIRVAGRAALIGAINLVWKLEKKMMYFKRLECAA